MSLLFNGSKAIDVVQTALEIGLLDLLEAGPVSLGELSSSLSAVPVRLYKLLDCLECCGFVQREAADSLLNTMYRAVPGVRQAAVDVVGPDSQERDRDTYPWRAIHGNLKNVLTGEESMPEDLFSWPPGNDTQIAAFEKSMAAGLGPAIEVFRTHAAELWTTDARLLDVGGGDGTLAARLLTDNPLLTIDVYNLPAVKSLVDGTRERTGVRLGFVGGDFLTESLPTGYDGMSFVRVLHDWPPETARALLAKAHAALRPGGKVMVCEEFRTPTRLAVQFFWSYFLIGVDSCTSMLREAGHYVRVLGDLGFEDIAVLDGPFEIVVGTKPSFSVGGSD